MKSSRFQQTLARRDKTAKYILRKLRRGKPFIMGKREARSMDALTGGSMYAAMELLSALGYTFSSEDADPSK